MSDVLGETDQCKCVSESSSTRCSGRTKKGGDFCSVHRPACIKLLEEYHIACDMTEEIGDCLSHDLYSLSLEDLRVRYRQYISHYKLYRECWKKRVKFMDKCIYPTEQDRGHLIQVKIVKQREARCEKIATQISEMIYKKEETLKKLKQINDAENALLMERLKQNKIEASKIIEEENQLTLDINQQKKILDDIAVQEAEEEVKKSKQEYDRFKTSLDIWISVHYGLNFMGLISSSDLSDDFI